MTDIRNDAVNGAWVRALSSLFEDECLGELLRIPRAEVDAIEGLSPEKWPTAGQAKINWDLSVQGREFTIDLPAPTVLQPAGCADVEIESMVLGKVLFSDFAPLLHPRFRLKGAKLWDELDPFKLGSKIRESVCAIGGGLLATDDFVSFQINSCLISHQNSCSSSSFES